MSTPSSEAEKHLERLLEVRDFAPPAGFAGSNVIPTPK